MHAHFVQFEYFEQKTFFNTMKLFFTFTNVCVWAILINRLVESVLLISL